MRLSETSYWCKYMCLTGDSGVSSSLEVKQDLKTLHVKQQTCYKISKQRKTSVLMKKATNFEFLKWPKLLDQMSNCQII
jgi:hypothetical protein